VEAELEALKNQIDPHFLFNSLNTLSHLIRTDPERAWEFNEHLADVYRYILINKEKELVELGEELEFVENYFSLLKLRFGDGIRLLRNGSGRSDDFLIPPISLQILLENAVKHNEIDEKSPLEISLRIEDSVVHVRNRKRWKSGQDSGSQVGLKGLNERYKLITGKSIEIHSDPDEFSVSLPLLKSSV
jgi:LytS/YehU family sensor histidine kinase